jgi:hypothetical protein
VPAHYSLQAQLDYWGHTLSVSESITYTNNSPEVLTELQLDVEPNRWAGGFVLESMTWGDGSVVSEYALTGNRLVIPLRQALQPAEWLMLHIEYELGLPAIPLPDEVSRPVPYGYTNRQTNLVDWYPYVPPYRAGEGWLLHSAGSFGEHQVYDMADFDVQIVLAQPVEGLVFAASAPAEQSAESYRYHLAAARNFALSASHVYVVNSRQVGDVSVMTYTFPFDTQAGEQVLVDSSEALRLYSELFGAYPYPSLSIVEADFLDGMEYNSLFFLSRGFYNLYNDSPKGYLTAIAAHETAHQWWYAQVGNDQALEPWLDEAMCTYSERIFYENVYPELLDWWWAFRVDYYQPSGVIDGAIYDYDSFRAYRDSVYLHGAQFFEELRSTVGDEVFLVFLHDYADRLADQQATAGDFFEILQEHTSADLDALRSEYFSP